MVLQKPSLSTRIRMALARPLDAAEVIEADRRAAIRFNVALLAAFLLAIAGAVIAWIVAPAAMAIP